jgi:sigma-E factor negative regulatory protein RseA
MKSDTTQYQSISSLLDGELNDTASELTLSSLGDAGNAGGRKTWEIYHQIGDVLRSDDLAMMLSPDFSSRLSALLDAEPVVMAPKAQYIERLPDAAPESARMRHSVKPGIARYVATSSVAAAAAVAFFMAPQIMSLFGGQSGSGGPNGTNGSNGSIIQLTKAVQPGSAIGQLDTIKVATTLNGSDVSSRSPDQIEMLRDPRLDSYLLAHQKFSPSMASGAQYVTRGNAVSAAASAAEK